MTVEHPLFSPEHVSLRGVIRGFVEQHIAPHIDEWEAAESFPRELWPQMGELGLLGLQYPAAFGGAGMDFVANLILVEELSRVGAESVCAAVAVQTAIATPPVAQFGTDMQRERYLRPAIQGKKIAALGITEPDAGSDMAGIRTTAVRDGDHWVINGRKVFITNGVHCDFIVLLARTDQGAERRGLSLFLVDKDIPGFVVVRALDKLGRRASDTAELLFENCRVSTDALLGELHRGFHHIVWVVQGERMIGAAASVAAARLALTTGIEYARQRVQFGRRISEFQAVRHRLADLAARIEAVQQLVYHTAWRLQNGQRPAMEISMCKLLAANVLWDSADYALQLHGGYGYLTDYPIQRIWRDARLKRISAGTDEIQREIVARELGL